MIEIEKIKDYIKINVEMESFGHLLTKKLGYSYFSSFDILELDPNEFIVHYYLTNRWNENDQFSVPLDLIGDIEGSLKYIRDYEETKARLAKEEKEKRNKLIEEEAKENRYKTYLKLKEEFGEYVDD